MQITDAEKSLIEAVRDLEFGQLFPDTLDMTATTTFEYPGTDFSSADKNMLAAIVMYGLPEVIEVANKAPTFAIFPVITPAGPGKKRIKFN